MQEYVVLEYSYTNVLLLTVALALSACCRAEFSRISNELNPMFGIAGNSSRNILAFLLKARESLKIK